MKILRSPNLAPGDDGITVRLVTRRSFARGGLASAADSVRRAGRFGDDMVIHINRREFEQLKKAWGEPHYNPQTKLPEFFDWWDAAKTVAPYVLGAFGKKASIDQANQNPAPPADPNATTHLGTGTFNRTENYTNHEDPSSFYTYGQKTGERQFFKNNSLGNVAWKPGAQVQPKLQSSPSTGQALLGGLAGGALQYVMKDPKGAYDAVKGLWDKYTGGRNVDANVNGPNGGDNGITWEPDASGGGGGAGGAAAGAAGAGAIPAALNAYEMGLAPALHGTVSVAELTAAEQAAADAAAASGGAAGATAGGAAAAGGGGGAAAAGAGGEALTEFTPTVSMATPGASGAAGGASAAGSGVGATLGGLAAGVGAAVALKHLSDNTAGLGYRDSRALADFMHTNAGIPDPTHGRGKYQNTPISPPPPGFKTWSQYFAVTQVIQQSMHASGGAKDQGTYKMLLQEQGVPTDINFYTKVWPGQEVAYSTIIGPNGLGNGSNSRGGRARGGLVQRFALGGPVGQLGAFQNANPFGPPGSPGSTNAGIMPFNPALGALRPPMSGAGNLGNGNMIQNAGGQMGNMMFNRPPPPPAPPAAAPPQQGGAFGQLLSRFMPPAQGRPQLPPMFGPPSANPVPPPTAMPGQPPAPSRPPFQPRMQWSGMGLGGPGQRRFDSGGKVSGPGTGTSDDIPARLSDGEYVIPAHVVAALGDGSTEAGAKRLDELQRQVRLRTGKQMARNRHPKPAKKPLAFLVDGAK